jgi:diguanylate cyclase (GGDEF)-like protein
VRLFSSLAATLGSRLSTDRLLDQLEIQARTDPLTGLANRGAIEADLDRRISDGRTGAVLLLDLDRFKDVNDSLGHQFGDQLLRLVAERLDQHVRASDLAGRLGGDEFAIVIDRPESDDLAPQINGLTSRLTAPVNLDGVTLEIGSSIGVACWPDDATSSADLLRLADIAMYEAKRTHKRWIRYDPSIDHASADRLALLGQVRDAIANRELLSHLQPQVGTHGLELVGAEALLRWNHPDRGLVPPNEFIPLAEHSSLASSITQHVINEAIDAVTRLHGEDHELRIWVNLTARDLLDESLAPALAVSILRSGIAPERLGFEVTEGSLIINLETAIATLGALQRLGCGTAIDDFGTGYASLRYLQRLPISEVKIDRSFVANATTNPSSAAIVRSTTRLVQDLGMTVVAEGVEDQPTLDLLRRIGCDTVQGYFVSPPVDLDSFIAWAGQHGRRLAPAHTASDPDRRVHPDRRPAPPARERRVD